MAAVADAIPQPPSALTARPPTEPPAIGVSAIDSRERKYTVGVLAIVLGFLAVHKFLLGYRISGTILLVISLATFGTVGWIIGIIEGCLILAMTDEEFHRTHVLGRRPWF